MGKAKPSVQHWENAEEAPDKTGERLSLSRSPFFMPRGMSLEQAARYIGLSPTKFTQMVQDRQMPPPRGAGTRRIWCRYALDEAFDELPEIRRSPTNDDNPWQDLK